MQDNGSSHKAHRTMQKFDQIGFELLHHPPYSGDLAPSDYHIFPQLKKYLKGTKFASDNDVIQATEAWFEDQSSKFYLRGLKDTCLKR